MGSFYVRTRTSSNAQVFKKALGRAGAFALIDRYVPLDQTRSWSIVGSWLIRSQAVRSH
jgi:hypothetical protein